VVVPLKALAENLITGWPAMGWVAYNLMEKLMLVRISAPWRVLMSVALHNALFFIPVAIAYYGLKGADLGGFLFIQGVFRLAVLVLEVPTGYLADRWSRPAQLRAAALLWIMSMALLFRADSFEALLVAEMVAALSVSLSSGTVQAYLHELLRAEGREAEQATWQGRLFAAAVGAETVASLLGGALFAVWVEAPTLATLACAVLGLAVTFSLPQVPCLPGERRHRNPLTDLWLVAHHSLRVHPRLPWLLLGPWTLFGLTGVLFWAMQGKLTALGLSPLMLGVVMASYQGIKTLLALNTGRLQRLPLSTLTLVMVGLLVMGTLMLLTEVPALIWVGGILAAGVVHAVLRPLVTTVINQEVADHERATVHSVASMVNQLLGAAMMVAAEPLLNHVSLTTLLVGYLLVTLGLAGYPLWRMVRT
jgi:MFS family permease